MSLGLRSSEILLERGFSWIRTSWLQKKIWSIDSFERLVRSECLSIIIHESLWLRIVAYDPKNLSESFRLTILIVKRSLFSSIDACEKIKCKFGSTCKNGRCTCPTYCDKQSEHDDLLCASNGRTFANDCDLKRYACLHQVGGPKILRAYLYAYLLTFLTSSSSI